MNCRTMIEQHLKGRDIVDPNVLAAMAAVPRERFVPENMHGLAYGDHPLPIGEGQTISQPYIVALMTQALELQRGDRVLEVGVGCGYQTAVLCELGARVYGLEVHDALRHSAQQRLTELGYRGFLLKTGDGHEGWPEHAPFDAILIAAAPETVPQSLLDQLGPDGKLIAPEGPDGGVQELNFYKKNRDESIVKRTLIHVRFVPLVKP